MKKISEISANSIVRRVAVALAALVVIVWFYPHQRTSKLFYEEGRPWNYAQLIAPFDIPIHPDSATVERMRDTLDARFVPIFMFDSDALDSVIGRLPGSAGERMSLAGRIRRCYDEGIVSAETMARIREGKLPRMRVLEGNTLSERSTDGLISVSDVYRRLDSLVREPALHQYLVRSDVYSLLVPNLVFDEAENKRHYDNEYQTMTADRGVILQGQAIINKGDIITPQDFTNLQTYEQLLEARLTDESRSDWLSILGQAVYVMLLLSALLGYCAIFRRDLFASFRAVLFILLLVTVFFLFSVALSAFIPGGVYIVPMVIVPILVLVFFDAYTAMFVSTVAVLIVAPVTSFTLEYVYLQFCASAIAVYTLRDLSRRSQLMRTSLLVAVTYVAAYVALELLMNGSFEGFTWRMPVFLTINALLTLVLYILMFAVEKAFGFVSTVTLIELADTNQPLLRKLSDTCPGTFQHSMSVSNLAADAARAMGANEELVRAGALYHDIGKMANPAFFTENQHGVNPHEALPPEQSARIVIGHVTDGLRMADRAGLPSVIKKFITEHHGTGKAKYFYYTYCQKHPDDPNPPAEDFTYPGPDPESRETSLLMMADAVEAASRSLKDYSRESITELVNKIIDGQIAEGLHAHSTLEFRDVPIIKEAFVKRLMTIYHTRIAYPSAPPQAAAAPAPASAQPSGNK